MNSTSTPQTKKRRGRVSTVVTPGVVTATPPATAPPPAAAPIPQSKAKAGVEAAKKMMDKCVIDTTKGGYKSKMALMCEWFKQNPMVDDDDNPIQLFLEDNITLKLPLPVDAVLAFFGYIGDQTVDEEGKPCAESEIQKSSSTMGSYRSAIVWYYKQHGKRISEEMDTSLSTYMSGYKRTIASLKLRGVMSIHEGKRPLEFEGYKCLSKHFLHIKPTTAPGNAKQKIGSWSQQLFAWPFFVFCWNMMARSITVGSMMYQHVSWSGDALTVNIPSSKCDKEGAKDYARHVYANPLEPAICPILSLAVMIFSSSFRSGDKRQQVFEGTKSESRFSSILRVIVDGLSYVDERILGAKKRDIGTHSPRKGSPTFALAMVEGPNPVQVFLRAGWSLGNVPDRYLFAGKGGDQLVGRVVSGLPMTDDRFGTLPPHFAQSVLESISEDMWLEMLPNYASYPSCFRCTLPFLLASVVYHDSWLRANLDSRHPLFNSRLYAGGFFAKYADKVLVGRVECQETGMVATGVPSHIMLSKTVSDLSKRLDAIECGHKRRHEEILTAFSDLKETLPKMLRTDILQNFEVNGALPLTQDDLSRSLESIASRLEESIERRLSSVRGGAAPEVTESNTSPQATFTHWTWGGRVMQMVPEGFRMPECSVKDLWDLWHFGHIQNRIGPFKRLRAHNFVVKTDNCELSKARSVINELHTELKLLKKIPATHENKVADYVSGCSFVESDALFTRAYEELAKKIFKNVEKHRIGDLRFNYVYNLVCKYKKSA